MGTSAVTKFLLLLTLVMLIQVHIQYPDHGVQANTTFSDIEAHWAKDTILWASAYGIVNGYPDGTFRPNEKVSEAEFLTMLMRTYHGAIANAVDEHWATPYYILAQGLNYPIFGEQDIAKRNEIMTRVRVAELISATQGVHYSGNEAIIYVLGHNLAQGSDPNQKTVASFHGSDSLTRAQAVTFIENLVHNGQNKLEARPEAPSDPELLPELPLQEEAVLDLPYTVPKGWTPPLITSTATESYNENKIILEQELGLLQGMYYNPYGRSQIEFAEIMVENGGANYIAQITIYSWFGDKTSAHDLNKIPYVAREVFKFYVPQEYGSLYSIMDDYFNDKDISPYVGQSFVLDGRQIKIVESPYSVSIFIGRK